MQGVQKHHGRNLRKFPFSTCPQPFFQLVDGSVERDGAGRNGFEVTLQSRRFRGL
jgi:hypothetical protein